MLLMVIVLLRIKVTIGLMQPYRDATVIHSSAIHMRKCKEFRIPFDYGNVVISIMTLYPCLCYLNKVIHLYSHGLLFIRMNILLLASLVGP